jgi:hypothetical protein
LAVGDDGFQKVGESDDRMYGPRALLLCGFPPDQRATLVELLSRGRLADAPVIGLAEADVDVPLADALARPHKSGLEGPSGLPRAFVVSGLTEQELQRLMAAYRSLGWERPLWAAVTPTSEGWTVGRLLGELSAEAAAFRRGGA